MKSNYSKQLTVMLSSLLFGVSLHFSAAANPILQQFKVNNSGFVGMMQGKDAEAKVKMPYTPNPDTVYSGLVADLTKEPLVTVVPDIPDRYFSIQAADAYLVNQHYIGTRAT